MKKKDVIQQFLLIGLFIIPVVNFAQPQSSFFSKKEARDELYFAVEKYKKLMYSIPVNRLPKSVNENGEILTSGSGWWCSGFYPGTLWYLYKFTIDNVLKTEAVSRTSLIEQEKWNKGTHDLGFMIFCSFGNGYKFTGESNYKPKLIDSKIQGGIFCHLIKNLVNC